MDLLIAATAELTRISVFSLYFQYYTSFSAALFCLMTYTAARIIIKNQWVALFTGIISVWTGNLS